LAWWRCSGKVEATRINPATIDVAPLTKKSQAKETAARNPPTAGPTLIPRLIASRFSANPAFLCSGRTRSPKIVRLAGRNASPRTDIVSVSAMTRARLLARGKTSITRPERSSDPRMIRIGPSRSDRSPEAGAATRAPAP
jgi:hypothetical protein